MKEKLKIGIILRSLNSPAWVSDLIRQIKSSGLLELNLIIVKAGRSVEKDEFSFSASSLFKILLKFYLTVENILVPVKQNFAEVINIGMQVKNIKTINLGGVLTNDQLKEIAALDLDVLLSVDRDQVPGELKDLFNIGVVYNKISIPGGSSNLPVEWFVINNQACIEAKLILEEANTNTPKKLSQLFFAPDSFFVNRVKSQYLWKASLITMRGLITICNMKNRSAGEKLNLESVENNSTNDIPGLSTFKVIKHFLFYLKKSIEKKINIIQWIILYRENSAKPEAIENYKKIYPPIKNFWADPHIVERDGCSYVFIEEYSYANKKGHISVFEINKNGKPTLPVKILEKPYHLSYPFIFDYEGSYYMIPESAQNGTVDIYKCTEFPFKWEFYKHIFVDISAVDSTVLFYEGKWWMFLNKKVDNYISYKDELYLYYSDSPFSEKWISHPQNPVVTDVRSARSAGRIYKSNGNLIRPSQDCSVDYGYKLRLNKIVKMNEEEYRETGFDIIEPNYTKKVCGIHTLAKSDGYTVLDCKLKRFKFPEEFNLQLMLLSHIF